MTQYIEPMPHLDAAPAPLTLSRRADLLHADLCDLVTDPTSLECRLTVALHRDRAATILHMAREAERRHLADDALISDLQARVEELTRQLVTARNTIAEHEAECGVELERQRCAVSGGCDLRGVAS